MKKLTFSQVNELCRQHNIKYDVQNQFADDNKLYFCAVLDPKYLKKYYSLKERTYIFTSDNKAFISRMCGYSIFGYCKYDHDSCRLEQMRCLYYYQCDKEGKPL